MKKESGKYRLIQLLFVAAASALALSACGSGGGGAAAATTPPPASYTVGGAVTGLVGSVVLQDNGGDSLTVSTSGNFTFATKIASGGAYKATVLTQPTGQTCSVTTGTGTLSGNVSNISVACTNNSYTVGGSVSGLTGSVVLQDNGGDNLTVSANGTFTFTTKIVNGNTYSASVLTQPIGQTCSVSTGAGTVSGNNVTNVAVVCSTNTYSVGGSVTGLSGTVVLQNNLGNNLSVSANGTYTFTTKIANASPYSVTVSTQPTGQSCSVASGTGTISLAAVTNVAISCSTNTYTIGGTVTGLNGSMVLQDNGADNLPVATNGTFSFATTVAYGNAFSVTNLSLQFPNQTCTITGGSGTVAANVTNVVINCAKFSAPRFVYSVNNTAGTISIFAEDSASGRLKLAERIAGVGSAASIAVDPSGSYAYVSTQGSTIAQYKITGSSLTPMSPATVMTGGDTRSIVVDPSGKYAYAVSLVSSNVWQYTIGASGALTAMTPANVAAGANAEAIAIDPTGRYAYVANNLGNSVSQFTIGASGALTAMTPASIPAGTGPGFITVDPTGRYVYVANYTSNNISEYAIGANGALTAMAAATIPAGTNPIYVTFDPTGKYAYVTNIANGAGGNSISQYTLSAAGWLTPMTPATVAAGISPQSIAVDAAGKYAYAVNQGGSISQYSIGATGALTALAPGSLSENTANWVQIIAPSGAAPLQAVPKYAYAVNSGGNNVSQFTVGANGALSNQATLVVNAGAMPTTMVVDPTGKYAYVSNSFNGANGNSISQYTFANGALTPMVTAAVGTCGASIASIAVDPSVRFLFDVAPNSVCWGAVGVIEIWGIGAGGALAIVNRYSFGGAVFTSVVVDPSGQNVYTADQTGIAHFVLSNAGTITLTGANVAAGVAATSLSIDPSGQYLYATYSAGNVSQFAIDATGALTAMTPASSVTGSTPTSVTVSPSGKYAYVANGANTASGNSVSQYTIGATGLLTAMTPATVAAGAGPQSVVVDPSGIYAYVANSVDNTVSQYTVGATGSLTALSTPILAGLTPKAVIITATYK